MLQFEVPQSMKGIQQIYIADGQKSQSVMEDVNGKMAEIGAQGGQVQDIRIMTPTSGSLRIIVFYMLPKG